MSPFVLAEALPQGPSRELMRRGTALDRWNHQKLYRTGDTRGGAAAGAATDAAAGDGDDDDDDEF